MKYSADLIVFILRGRREFKNFRMDWQQIPDSVQIGQEYIIKVVGEDFIEKQLYFVCLLCHPDNPKNEKFPELEDHLTNLSHQWKFLVGGYEPFREVSQLVHLCVEWRF